MAVSGYKGVVPRKGARKWEVPAFNLERVFSISFAVFVLVEPTMWLLTSTQQIHDS